MTQTFLSQLNWRFATKAFDPAKKVSDGDLAKILEAIRLAPTSYGLQPFHVEVIADTELRSALLPVSYRQSQVMDSSFLLVFCARNDIASRIDAYVELASKGDADAKAKLEPMKQMMNGDLSTRTPEKVMEWAGRQTYLALGFGLAAAAELGIDACPMEGFNSTEVNKVLGLPAHMHAFAYMALGYRKDDPAASTKVRFPETELFEKR